MRLLDRYLIRETLTPFLLALAVSTFIFQINPILEKAEVLLAKGVPAPTVGYLLLTLLPQALGVTLPIAFLIGLLMALGRISGDRESVAILACGVSPLRLLWPVALMAIVIAAANLYVMTTLVPDANQSFREVTFRFLAKQSEADIKPREFYEGFPSKVLFIRESNPAGGWSGVLVADTSPTHSGRPAVTLAESGVLSLDEQKREVNLFLRGVFHYAPGASGDEYEVTRTTDYRVSIPASSVFGAGDTPISRGNPERKIPDLLAEIENKRQVGLSPHNEIMYLHQMFSFPVACLVFAPIGLALGLHTRREGKLAGLTLGMIVVFAYWALMAQAEAMTKGQHFPAEWSRWVPNLVLAPVGIAALWWRSRARGREIRIPMPALPSFLRKPAPAAPGAAASSAPRVVVVIRIPHVELPRPRLLDVYIGGKYLRMIALAAVGLLGLYYIAEFLDKSDNLFKGQADGPLMLEYLWHSTPRFLAFIVPIATLLGVLGTIGTLTRTGELTVMRACGISLYRAALPLFALALMWSGLLFVLDDRLIAQATQKAEALEARIKGNEPRTVNVLVNRHWLAKDGRIYYYLAYQRQRLFGLSVYETQAPPYRLVSHTYASRAEYRDNGWEADTGWIQSFPAIDQSAREVFRQRPVNLAEPEVFENAQVDAGAMTFGELRTYIQQQHASGFSLADERVSLHKKVAFPAVTLVMTLLAVPFAVTTGRRGALYGIGLALILAIAYFLLTAVFSAAGKATVLPPMLAAWAPNLFFMIAAAYLMLRVRT